MKDLNGAKSMLYIRWTSPKTFVILTFTITWLFWIPAAVYGVEVMRFPYVLLIAFGGLGPAVAGVFLTYKTRDKEGRRDYWRRIVDFKRIGAKWYMVIVLTFPVIIAMAILADIASCGKSPQFETLVNLSSDPLKIFYFLIFMLLFGPIPEELGWRGYVLDRLQEKRTALASSLILGIAWTFWHLPLFFMKGFYHHDEVGFGTPGCLSFCVYTVAFAILITWVYNNTRRSTLSAILFHFMGNFTAEAVTLSERADNFKSLLLVLSAVVVTIFWRPHTLTKK